MGFNKKRTAFRGRSAQRTFSKGTSCGLSISGVCRALLCVFCAVKLIIQNGRLKHSKSQKNPQCVGNFRKCFNNDYLWSYGLRAQVKNNNTVLSDILVFFAGIIKWTSEGKEWTWCFYAQSTMMVISRRMTSGVCVLEEGGGGCHVKTSKIRKQSPYPYILIDHLCLDLDSLERARLPCQINRRL